MSKLLYFSQTAMCLLLTSCSLALNAQTMVNYAVNEYTSAAQSGNLNRYTQACNKLIEAAKNSDSDGAYFCWRTALEVLPKHNHNYRIAAYLCSIGFWPFINTCTHTLSSRGDTTPCHITSTLAGIEASGLTVVAASTACVAAVCLITGQRNEHGFIAGLATIGLTTLAAIEWANVYCNIVASREKSAFDDAHKSLLRSLDVIVRSNQAPVIMYGDSYVIEIQAQ
jgi:hypothetical protein